MTKPYPMEMRERAVKFVEAGESRHAVAARFGIAASTVIKWLARHAKTGSAAPARMGGYRPKKIAGKHRDWLLERMKAGDFTLQGLAGELEQQGLKVDYKTVWTFVHGEGQSFKKNPSRRRTAAARRSQAPRRVVPSPAAH
jgi:transposase